MLGILELLLIVVVAQSLFCPRKNVVDVGEGKLVFVLYVVLSWERCAFQCATMHLLFGMNLPLLNCFALRTNGKTPRVPI